MKISGTIESLLSSTKKLACLLVQIDKFEGRQQVRNGKTGNY
ncbi:hypothetical protein ACT3CE_03340 [Marinifilum sp. RC60d5]